MNRAELEALLCDYIDGTLSASQRKVVEQHLATHPEDAAWVKDAQAGLAFLERVPTVNPPPELITRILFETRPPGRSPSDSKQGFWKWLSPILEPVLQPRFVMGMAMTILSFSMLGRFAGMEVRQLKPSDLSPSRVWSALDDKAHRAWQRAVKFYENMRLVYEAQNRLREWVQVDENKAQTTPSGQAQQPKPASTPAPNGQSRQSEAPQGGTGNETKK